MTRLEERANARAARRIRNVRWNRAFDGTFTSSLSSVLTLLVSMLHAPFFYFLSVFVSTLVCA